MDFYQKYLKYKRKYQELKMLGGALDGYTELHDIKNAATSSNDNIRIIRKNQQCRILIIRELGSKKQISQQEYQKLLNNATQYRIPKETLDYCLNNDKIKVDSSVQSDKLADSCNKLIVSIIGNKKQLTQSEYQDLLQKLKKFSLSQTTIDYCLKKENIVLLNYLQNNIPPKVQTPYNPPQNMLDQYLSPTYSAPRFNAPIPPPLPQFKAPNIPPAPLPQIKAPVVPAPLPQIKAPINPTPKNILDQYMAFSNFLPPPNKAPLPQIKEPLPQIKAPPAQAPSQLIPNEYKALSDDNLEFFFNFNKSKNTIIQKYNNLAKLESPIKRIGTPSENGFINKLSFGNNQDKNLFLIAMKTSKKETADNNYYEFTVGRCLNKIKHYFPNFIYTFEFMNVNPTFKNLIQNDYYNVDEFKKNVIIKNINNGEEIKDTNIELGCSNNVNSSIWLQWIPNSMSLKEIITLLTYKPNRNTEVFNILFQVYATLNGLKDIYTHYDLHTGNVAYVPVPENKKILIVYHIKGKEYKIHTHFIPVILDYGRSHIDCKKFGSEFQSKDFGNVGCTLNSCRYHTDKSICVSKSGVLFNKDTQGNFSSNLQADFIIPATKNVSHDLRYLYLFMRETSKIQDLLANVNLYSLFGSFEEKEWFNYSSKVYSYGVPEISTGFNYTILKKVKNITDALDWLLSIYDKIYEKNPIENDLEFGRMDIYPELDKELKEWTFTRN